MSSINDEKKQALFKTDPRGVNLASGISNASPDTPQRGVAVAVVIPVFNNEKTIESVVRGAREQCGNVIVVNDGSTDRTGAILKTIKTVHLIGFEHNRGKGAALAAGFDEARVRGFTHVITLDADGQHYPKDIALFLQAVKQAPDTLWIGNRTIPFQQSSQPSRSRFGRSFGNFWYKFNTGVHIHDTQCGFRAYPLEPLSKLRLSGVRYEYEQEALIKAAWNGVPVKEIDIHLFYEPSATRVSHFRPILDFARISRVNASAAFIRTMFPVLAIDIPGDTWKQKVLRLFKHELKAHTTPKKAAASLATGVFMGIFPIHGFQVASLIGLSAVFKINRPLALLGVCISSPPLLPFIIISAVAIGRLFVPGELTANLDNLNAAVLQGAAEFVVGSAILAVVAGIVAFAAAYPFFKALAQKRAADPVS